MSFLPTDYKIPEKSNYTKFEQGETLLRILEAPILGWELWVKGKPLRRRMTESFTMEEMNNADINKFNGKPKTPQHFWAMVVWNYEQNCLQIWQITQKKIMAPIKALSASKAWGSPLEYDLSVNKTGEQKETDYTVMPSPKEKISDEIKEAYQTAQIDVSKLFTGEDPFSSKPEFTKAMTDKEFEAEQEDISNDIPF